MLTFCLFCWFFLMFEFYFIYFLYSRFLLVIYFTHISVYMSIPSVLLRTLGCIVGAEDFSFWFHGGLIQLHG